MLEQAALRGFILSSSVPFPSEAISLLYYISVHVFFPPDMPHTVYCIHVLTIQTVSLALLYVLVCVSLHAFVLVFFQPFETAI